MYKISSDMEGAEILRRERVPSYYMKCSFRKVTAQPWDHFTEETPLFVECMHPVYGKENYSECLGQCALGGQLYGIEEAGGKKIIGGYTNWPFGMETSRQVAERLARRALKGRLCETEEVKQKPDKLDIHPTGWTACWM